MRSRYRIVKAAKLTWTWYERFERAQPLYREYGDVEGEAHCNLGFAQAAFERSDYGSAREHCEKALPLYRKVGNLQGEADCLRCLGDIALKRSDREESRALFDQALPLYRKAGNLRGEALCIQSLGDLARENAGPLGARGCYEHALSLPVRSPDPYAIGFVHQRLAAVAAAPAERAAHLQRAREAWQSIGRDDLIATLHANELSEG